MFDKRRSCSDNEPDVADKARFMAGKAAPSAGKASAAVAEAAGDAPHQARVDGGQAPDCAPVTAVECQGFTIRSLVPRDGD